MINPRSILWMRVERNVAAWSKLRFELKDQSTQAYGDWVIKVLASPHFDKHPKAGKHWEGLGCFEDFIYDHKLH